MKKCDICGGQNILWPSYTVVSGFVKQGAHLTKPGWSKPHTHSNPTNLALFRRKITLYRFNLGESSYYCRGDQMGAGAEPPPPEPPHFNHCSYIFRGGHNPEDHLRPWPVVELRWGPRGSGPPERPGGPRETSVMRGIKGACKRPPWNCKMITHYYAALLPRRGPHIASHSVCPSVCLSVRPSRYR